MCGIAGIVRFDDQPIAPDRSQALLARLRHRGPDGEGMVNLTRCALVHTRLAILDPRNGQQPMSVPAWGNAGPLTVVFNGEIYNHRELRRELETLGHSFHTDHCDTEVLLHGFRQWGTDLPRKLEGMFACALWDAAERRLFLCRDRMGKKPLYFSWRETGNGRELVFASLPAALRVGLADSPSINRQALQAYLRLGYTDQRSLLAGVEELPAAHWLMVDAAGQTKSVCYWRPPTAAVLSPPQNPAESVLEVLQPAVRRRLEADVPLGCFLSGGIDSSLIAALAQQELTARNAGPLYTFTVQMPDLDYDESSYALAVARHIGAEHHVLHADATTHSIADLVHLIRLTGELTADSSILPTYWLSKATRPHVAVALSGDGGDELFGGYDRYRALALLARHRWWLRRLPAWMLPRSKPLHPHAQSTRLRRLRAAAQAANAAAQYQHMIALFTAEQMARLLPDEKIDEWVLPDWPNAADPVRAAMRWDAVHYLPFDLLRKVDRAAMAVALEVRCPLLDTQVWEWAAQMPTAALLPGGISKGLLRRVAARFLPGAIVQRPKRGFALPIGRWFTERWRQPLTEWLLSGRLETLGMSRQFLQCLLTEHVQGRVDHTHRLFALLSLTIWLEWSAEHV